MYIYQLDPERLASEREKNKHMNLDIMSFVSALVFEANALA